jgi:hypothetical protein
LIDVADRFIELDSHLEEITKAESRYNSHSGSYHISARSSGSFTRVQDEETGLETIREIVVDRQ